MRKILYLLLMLTSPAFGQEVELGTVFKIEFNNLKNNVEFTIVSKQPFDGIIEDSRIESVVSKNPPAENQIIGVLAKGKFGDKISSMLVLVSGVKQNINYSLAVKTSQNDAFQPTSTSSLLKNIRSIEYWPYDIERINFTGFKIVPPDDLNILPFQIEVDSTCLKNAAKNAALSEQVFKSQFKSIVQKFEGESEFKIEELLKYEKSINSEDVSLGYFWSLGEGIYPNKKHYKFGNPVSFRSVECPYFDGTTNYFYTKMEGDVKVVGFEWETFKESILGVNPELKDIKLNFTKKYDFLIAAVSEILGKPKKSGRFDTRWRSQNGTNGYLFRFKNYNEIRLYIYKE